MCGISIIVQQNHSPVNRSELHRMTDLAAHRGPDAEGYFTHDNWGFGHRRLSIVDPDPQSNQPMHYAGNTVTYNGEIFNYLELKQALAAAGFSFSTQSDTEVLLAAYQHWGAECLHHFNGMWAFALFDARSHELFFARDRYGIKPLYYTTIQGKFCVASEIKQFSAVEGWKPVLNRARAFDFLNNGCFDHTEETLFEGVFQLPQGCYMVLQPASGHLNITKYYDLRERITHDIEREERVIIEQFRQLFFDATALRLRSDVKVGTALSGGLDSTAIAMTVQEILLMDKGHNAMQECVSVMFSEAGFNENAYIDLAAEAGRFTTHRVQLDFAALSAGIDETLRSMDEPFGSMTMIAGNGLFRAAANCDIRVLLNGQGADEILAGYDKFYKPYFLQLLKKGHWRRLLHHFRGYRRHHTIRLGEIARQMVRSFKNKPTTLPWLQPDFIPPEARQFRRSTDADIQSCSVNLIQEIGLPMLLHYEDRNSMAHSVEARMPFLDHRLVEFCISLPDHLKINGGIRKYIQREALADLLPEKIYQRYDKLSFICPESLWMHQYSSFFQAEIAKAVRQHPAIFNAHLRSGFEQYLSGQLPDDAPFWRAIIFSRWMEIMKIGSSYL